MRNFKWFIGIKTMDELKKRYKKLALQNHPDMGGDTRTMQEINVEYDFLFKHFDSLNEQEFYTNPKNADKEYHHEDAEFSREFINWINSIGVDIEFEVTGSWYWISGSNTYSIRNVLKQKMCWSKTHKKWYWYQGMNPYHTRRCNAKFSDFEKIKDKYGYSTGTNNKRNEKEVKNGICRI